MPQGQVAQERFKVGRDRVEAAETAEKGKKALYSEIIATITNLIGRATIDPGSASGHHG